MPKPFDQTDAQTIAEVFVAYDSFLIDCPVHVTLTDAQGRRSGYVPPPAVASLVDEIPGVWRTLLRKADGTQEWGFWVKSDQAVTMTISAYGGGPMGVSVPRPADGTVWTYRTDVTAGEVATLSLPSGLSAPPEMTFAVVQLPRDRRPGAEARQSPTPSRSSWAAARPS